MSQYTPHGIGFYVFYLTVSIHWTSWTISHRILVHAMLYVETRSHHVQIISLFDTIHWFLVQKRSLHFEKLVCFYIMHYKAKPPSFHLVNNALLEHLPSNKNIATNNPQINRLAMNFVFTSSSIEFNNTSRLFKSLHINLMVIIWTVLILNFVIFDNSNTNYIATSDISFISICRNRILCMKSSYKIHKC